MLLVFTYHYPKLFRYPFNRRFCCNHSDGFMENLVLGYFVL